MVERHLIIGNGNLGKDLFLELQGRMKEVRIVSKSRGVDVTNLDAINWMIKEMNATHVWYCVGGGSVAESKYDHPDFYNSLDLNFRIPVHLARTMPEGVNLILFSTDYVADETRANKPWAAAPHMRSKYAENKLMMETWISKLNRPNTTVVRVGSLYGVHKPEKTFPGKILANFGFNQKQINLPSNIVVPTPTRWIASMLLDGLEHLLCDSGPLVHHCAPEGGVSVKDWAKFVLKGFRDDSAFTWGKDFFDNERPIFSGLGCTFSERKDHWFDLWNTYFNPEWFTPKDLKIKDSQDSFSSPEQ